MFTNISRIVLLAPVAAFLVWGCPESSPTGPNELGGETNLELTEVGNEFPLSLSADPSLGYIPGFQNLEDSIVVTERNDGIVTFDATFTFDTAFVSALDSIFGTGDLDDSMKRQIIDTYLDRYDATLDSTDKENITVKVDAKMKITSEGIQEFINSKGDESKPFTLVKYNASVGDKYQFTTEDGITITREVTRRSTEDDFPVAYWLLKVVEVEESRPDDLLIDKYTYYANHKFGLVGVDITTTDGKTTRVTVFPPTL